MKLRIYIYIYVLCSIYSCTTNSEAYVQNVESKASLNIDTLSSALTFKLRKNLEKNIYECIDSINIIQLETNDNSLIGNINDVKIMDSKIFVTDMYKARSIFVFDMNGNFLYKVGSIGHGPGEYVNLNYVNITNHNIDILDWTTWKYIRYDITGKYLMELNVSQLSPSSMIEYKKNEWLLLYQNYAKEHPYRIVYTDSLFKTKQTGLPFTNTRNQAVGQIEKSINGDLYFYYPLCDTVFQITDSLIYPRYCLSLYDNDALNQYKENTKNYNDREFLMDWNSNTKNIIKNFRFFESTRYLHVCYRFGHEIYNCFIDKTTNLCKTYLTMNYDNNEGNFPFDVYGFYNDYLVSVIDHEKLKILSNENLDVFCGKLNKQDRLNLKTTINNSTKNPVICLIHIKIENE